MRYFLSQNTRENRLMIDDHGSTPGCPILEEVEASSWVEAKRLFAFPLTTIQEMLPLPAPVSTKERLALAEMCRLSRAAKH